MDIISQLADALQRADILPWAVVPPDALPSAWVRSHNGLAMCTVLAHLFPHAFERALQRAAETHPPASDPDARRALGMLHTVTGVFDMIGPGAAIRELRHLLEHCAPTGRPEVEAALCTAVRDAVPTLTAREVVAAVSAR